MMSAEVPDGLIEWYGIDWDEFALWGDAAGLPLSPEPPDPAKMHVVERLTLGQERADPIEIVKFLLSQFQFEEVDRGLVLGRDLVRLARKLPDGRIEHYLEGRAAKYHQAHNKGEPEAWSGTGKIGNHEVAVFGINFDFMGGSVGVVAGEKFQRTADLAQHHGLPLIPIFASGGARQQEGTFALTGCMEKMSNAVRNFMQKGNHLPYVAVLTGEVWGGVSASPVPIADVRVASAGGNFGFSGPRVIENHEHNPVPRWAQSVEKNLLDRNIEVVVKDDDELQDWLERFIAVTKKPDAELKPGTWRELPTEGEPRTINFGPAGFAPALLNRQEVLHEHAVDAYRPTAEDEGDELEQRYRDSIRSSGLLDAEFVIQNVFSEFVPLYNHYIDGEKKVYPAIIAAIGKIGPQPFLVIGNQPSYEVKYGKVRRISASPSPKDFEFAQRMMKMADHLDLPLVFLTDTLGAEPSLKSEEMGQSASIANTIYDANGHRKPVLSIVLNALGSGGGLATAPMGEWRAMMSRSMAYVAEPSSATAILDRVPNPEPEAVRRTLTTMSATAQDQLRMGLIDEIITEFENPYLTLREIHRSIARAYDGLPSHGMHRRRNKRVRDIGKSVLRDTDTAAL